MPPLPGTWLQRLFTLPQVRELRSRVEELERNELERERVVAEQLEQLTKLFKRQRTRDARQEAQDPTQLKPGEAKAALRRELIPHKTGHNGTVQESR